MSPIWTWAADSLALEARSSQMGASSQRRWRSRSLRNAPSSHTISRNCLLHAAIPRGLRSALARPCLHHPRATETFTYRRAVGSGRVTSPETESLPQSRWRPSGTCSAAFDSGAANRAILAMTLTTLRGRRRDLERRARNADRRGLNVDSPYDRDQGRRPGKRRLCAAHDHYRISNPASK